MDLMIIAAANIVYTTTASFSSDTYEECLKYEREERYTYAEQFFVCWATNGEIFMQIGLPCHTHLLK